MNVILLFSLHPTLPAICAPYEWTSLPPSEGGVVHFKSNLFKALLLVEGRETLAPDTPFHLHKGIRDVVHVSSANYRPHDEFYADLVAAGWEKYLHG